MSVDAPEKLFDFEQQTANRWKWKIWSSADEKWLHLFQGLYDRHHPSKIQPSESPIIPRVIHQIWLGPRPVPAEWSYCMDSWRALHPDWEYRLWTDADVNDSTIVLRNRELFDSSANYAQKCDILRLEILYQFGGVYADIDFECIQNVELLHKRYGFYVGLSNVGAVELNNGLIGSQARHPFLFSILNKMSEPFVSWGIDIQPVNRVLFMCGTAEFSDPSMQIIATTGPGFLTRAVASCLSIESDLTQPPHYGPVAILPQTFFHPVPNTSRHLSTTEKSAFVTPWTFAIHHWACTWQS